MKNCTPLWCEARFEVKMHKIPQVAITFGSSDVGKVYAVVARFEVKMRNPHHARTAFGS